jgi:hypothetical protein
MTVALTKPASPRLTARVVLGWARPHGTRHRECGRRFGGASSTADVGGMLEARDAGAGHGKGANRDTPDGLPPSSAGVLGNLEQVTEQGRRGQLNLTETRHREI